MENQSADAEEMTENPVSGGRLIVNCLRQLGATKCFGVPGESYLDVLNALHDTKGELDFVLCRNEGGAAFMAEAWGKLTGQPGICMVTRGPGATNASIGVHTAKQNSSPMLLLIGQVATTMRDREAFQEIDYRAFYGSIAKWVFEIDHAKRIPEILSRAWTTALSGRPGPVVLALPEDVLAETITVPPCLPVTIPQAAPPAGTGKRIAEILKDSSRPLVIAGGGGWTKEAKADLCRFVENNELPILSAFRYHDVFDNQHRSYCGDAGVGMQPHVRKLISETDLILAINIRFGEMTTDAWSLLDGPNAACRIIHSHASDAELGKIYAADLPIHAAPGPMAAMLASIEIDAEKKAHWQPYARHGRAAYEDALLAPDQPGDVDMGKICAWLRETLPNDAVITNGAGNFAIWANKHLQFSPERRLLAPQSGAMGAGLPAAIAARIADPTKVVVCFAGDGDFQMNCQELGTAAQAGAQPIVLIVNNGSYGTIRMHQEREFPGRVVATDIVNPDFVALTQSYGFHAERVQTTEDFAPAFNRALASESGAVLELTVSTEAITPARTLTQIRSSALADRNGA